jgi:hypothetical protein
MLGHCIYNLSIEYRQLMVMSNRVRYFLNVWNYIDIIPNLLVLVVLIISIQKENNPEEAHIVRYLNAVSSFFIWFKFMYFFRIFRSFGHLINAIVSVLSNMRVFMVIVSFSILAFSGTFFILAQNNKGDDVFVQSYIESISHTFELMIGQFQGDKLGTEGYAFVYFFYSFAAMFLIVVMLNLLIAIISSTFENVNGEAQKRIYQEFSQLICENIHLLKDEVMHDLDSQGNYLFIAKINNESGTSSKDLDAFTNSPTKGISKAEVEEIVERRIGQMERSILAKLDEVLKSKN